MGFMIQYFHKHADSGVFYEGWLQLLGLVVGVSDVQKQ